MNFGRHHAVVVLASLIQGAAAQPAALSKTASVSILEHSTDRAALERAAITLASSNDPQSIAELGKLLRSPEFLARLDNLRSPADKTRSLSKVLLTIAKHPSAATEQLCLSLAADPVFLSDDDRRIYLLPALAAVKPMSEQTVNVMRRASQEGYFLAVAPLLTRNGSPQAISLFEEMIRDRGVPPARRIDALHTSILPWRTSPAVLDCAGRLLSDGLEDEVAAGLVESLFDDQSRRWFGTSRSAPVPPPWEDARRDALEKVLTLASAARGRQLSPELISAINRTVETIQRILAK